MNLGGVPGVASWAGVAALAGAGYVGAAVLANRYAPSPPPRVDGRRLAAAPRVGSEISLLTWNLGYAGLGAESEFVVDGGRRVLAPSRRSVAANARGLVATLKAASCDAALLQEIAERGPLNHNRDLRRDLDAGLDAPASGFTPDFESRLAPWPLRARHGLGVYAWREMETLEARRLPNLERPWFGVVRKAYAAMVARLPIGDGARAWTIFNVHLSAFGRGRDSRRAQIAEVFEMAAAAEAAGDAVIVGGDWNAAPTEALAREGARPGACAWLEPIPMALAPPGWRLAFDPSRPTVRALDAPYRPGVTATAVIDGFLLARGVELIEVETLDLGFAHSDHNPVRLRARVAA